MITMPTIYPVTAHTQHVGPGSLFVAVNGFKEDGVNYIETALERGATTIVIADDAVLLPEIELKIRQYNAQLVRVKNTRKALAELSAQAAGNPAHKLKIIGFTGTKGKTTSVYLLEHILRVNGFKTARITGVSNMICGQELLANLTTPQPDYLHQFLKLAVEQGVTHVVMEVAAQALSLNRVDTIIFDAAIFTNLGREHFELYESMEQYCAIKAQIFEHTTKDSLCLVHAADKWALACADAEKNIVAYGFDLEACYSAINQELYPVSFVRNGERITCPSLIGLYNAQNLLGAVLVAERYGLTAAQINRALKSFGPIPGRMERYSLPNNVTAIIDYAHNPSSYEALLSTLRPLTNQLIVLFGASGTRDKGKRPLMGAIAARFADQIVLTSDNPGPEDPLHIIECIKAGIPAEKQQVIITEPDRALAIKKAYAIAKSGAIIALLGKGPDEYQVVQGQKTKFSERTILQELSL
jgi:UDP-N-acetylmuramoyl-L-alanyl-D-glutamate--2,6-diaminopimelate ligase